MLADGRLPNCTFYAYLCKSVGVSKLVRFTLANICWEPVCPKFDPPRHTDALVADVKLEWRRLPDSNTLVYYNKA